MTLIGVDPGTRTGLVFWDSRMHKIIRVETYDFWEAYECVLDFTRLHGKDTTMIVLENPGANKHVYGGLVEKPGSSRMIASIGGVRRESALLGRGWRRKGLNLVEVRPKYSKLNGDAFRELTGYTGKTNEHVRDAGMVLLTIA